MGKMGKYIVDYGVYYGDKTVKVGSLKRARAVARALIIDRKTRYVNIYLGDEENGIDGTGETNAWVKYSKELKSIVYAVMKDIEIRYYAINPDGSLGRLLETEYD